MGTEFGLITDEFEENLENLRSLIIIANSRTNSTPLVRVAAANSVTLILAATFEEFIRQMARCFAKMVVTSMDRVEQLPRSLRDRAWRRTMETLMSIRPSLGGRSRDIFHGRAKFNAIFEFCRGDLNQDIYDELIHNENNMRPRQINALFKVSGLKNVCSLLSDKWPIYATYSQSDKDSIHGQTMRYLDEFFDRRNVIAHSLKSRSSSGSVQIARDIDFFLAFGKALCETLEARINTSLDQDQADVDN